MSIALWIILVLLGLKGIIGLFVLSQISRQRIHTYKLPFLKLYHFFPSIVCP